MRREIVCVLLLSLPAIVLGYYVNDYCGSHIYVDSLTHTYFVRGSLYSDCVLHFDQRSSRSIALTITASDCFKCQINVYGLYNNAGASKTGSNLCTSSGYINRTVTSSGNDLGELYLHAQGLQCPLANLTFTVGLAASCSDGSVACSSSSTETLGTGTIVGMFFGTCAAAVVVLFVLRVYCKRRVVVVRRNVVVQDVAVVTQTRW